MNNFKHLFWMLLFVFFVTCVHNTNKKTDIAKHDSAIARNQVRTMVKILLNTDSRSKFCDKSELLLDGEKLEQIQCDWKGVEISYSLIGERSLTFTLSDGDAIMDAGLDGTVDFGISADQSKHYYKTNQPQYLVGEEYFIFWQQKFEILMKEIEKDLDAQSSRSFIICDFIMGWVL